MYIVRINKFKSRKFIKHESSFNSPHPDLAKRIVRTHPESGQDTLENMSAATLAERWRSGEVRQRLKRNE